MGVLILVIAGTGSSHLRTGRVQVRSNRKDGTSRLGTICQGNGTVIAALMSVRSAQRKFVSEIFQDIFFRRARPYISARNIV